MRKLSALFENILADLRDSRVSTAPTDRTTLSPVWVVPMLGHPESTASLLDRPLGSGGCAA